jgi:hypothetical protein
MTRKMISQFKASVAILPRPAALSSYWTAAMLVGLATCARAEELPLSMAVGRAGIASRL